MRQRKPQLDNRQRILWIALLLFTWMVVIIWRLGWLQVVKYEYYLAKATRNQQKEVESVPIRGAIQDRHGKELAYTVISDSLFVDLKVLKEDRDRQQVSQALAPLIGFEPEALLKKLTGDSSFVWLKRKLEPESAQAIKAAIAKNRLTGVGIKKESQRFYPNDSLAAHLVGYVGSDSAGQGGLEQTQNQRLLGKPGEISLLKDARGQVYQRRDMPGLNGAHLMTTIDSVLQHKVEVLIQEALSMSRAKGVSAIVLDPATGEILAMANAPTFNPNESPRTGADAIRHNRAISFPYEPGSVFKVVAYAAAFESGLARPDDHLDCGNGEISLGKRVIHDTHSYGNLTVADAFAKSSNVGAIKLAQRVGRERFFEFINRFGFGVKTGVELPGESRGIVNELATWRPDSIGSVAIGQEISVTLLQVVASMATIANGGVWIQPHIIKQVVGDGGDVLYQTQPETRRVVSEETARKMTEILERVVTNGTARHAIQLAGYTAAGKTGTPQKVDEQTRAYSKTRYMPSFAGFVPATKPRFAIVVMLDEPVGLYHGGSVAAPVFNLIAEAALGDFVVQPDDQSFRAALAKLSQKYETEGANDKSDEGQTAAQIKEPAPGAVQDRAPDQQKQVVLKKGGAPVPGEPARSEITVSSNVSSSMVVLRPAQKKSGAGSKEATFDGVVPSGVMPDIRGRGVRAVAQTCSELNLRLRLYGSGVAVRQTPAPGTRVKSGDECKVEFQ